MKKKIIITFSIIVLILIGVGYYLFTNLDAIVKSIIETTGTKIAGTEVTVGKVKLSVTEGSASIYDLKLANPKGFSEQSMIDLGEVTAQVNYKTGAISKIHIGSPHFLFEQKGVETNFGVLQKNIAKNKNKEKTIPESETKQEKETPPKTIQIDSFTINDAKVSFVSVDTKQSKEFTLDKISFSNLKGTPEQISAQALEQLATKIIIAVSKKEVMKQLQGSIKGETGEAVNKVLNNFLK